MIWHSNRLLKEIDRSDLRERGAQENWQQGLYQAEWQVDRHVTTANRAKLRTAFFRFVRTWGCCKDRPD
jgi:hypothetical protein